MITTSTHVRETQRPHHQPFQHTSSAATTRAFLHQATWWSLYYIVGNGFPFFYICHPAADPTGILQRWIHPTMYWSFLSLYKIVWSSFHAVRVAQWLTEPSSPPRIVATLDNSNNTTINNTQRSSSNTNNNSYPHKTDRLVLQYLPTTRRFWALLDVPRTALQCLQRERVIRFNNLRYQHQWSHMRQTLADGVNQRSVRALVIQNKWVAFGSLGTAIQDVLDEALDRPVLRPAQLHELLRRTGQSLPHLQEVSIAMSRSLPLSALQQLLEHAPHLAYLRLDGVALSVRSHHLQQDLLDFRRWLSGFNGRSNNNNNNNNNSTTMNGRRSRNTTRRVRFQGYDNEDDNDDNDEEDDESRRAVSTEETNNNIDNDNNTIDHNTVRNNNNNNNRYWPLKTLRLEDCRLEQEERDPQLRQRYSMDLLLAPVLFTALAPPTRLALLQHLTLWVKCGRISAIELAVMLSTNTSLQSLDLHLIRDKSNDIEDMNNNNNNNNHGNNNTTNNSDDVVMDGADDDVDWVVVPLAQVLQYSNTTLLKLSLQVPAPIIPNGVSHKALLNMIHDNEFLTHVHLLNTSTQRRIRVEEIDFYAHLNQLDRRSFRMSMYNECPSTTSSCDSDGNGTGSDACGEEDEENGCHGDALRRQQDQQNDQEQHKKWVELIVSQRRHVAVVFYFLSLNPSLLLRTTITTTY